jgi:hypothetical protein
MPEIFDGTAELCDGGVDPLKRNQGDPFESLVLIQKLLV